MNASTRKTLPFLAAVIALGGLATLGEANSKNEGKKPPPPARKAIIQRLREVSGIQRPENLKGTALDEWNRGSLKLRQAKFTLKWYQPTATTLARVSNNLEAAETAFNRARSGKPIPVIEGEREEAYVATNDRSIQPFVRYLPKGYVKSGERHPLLVFLHGYSPYLNIVNWSTLRPELTEFAKSTNACVAMPFARGNTDFQGVGEQDVLRCVSEMEKRYRVDRDRIFLIGFSMGGMGAWTIAGHHPHLFAGVIVLSGRGDYYFWHNIDPDKIPSHKRLLIDREFGATLLPNLMNTPIRLFHGEADTLIPVEEARHFAKLLKEVHPDFQYEEIPGADHWITEAVFAKKDLIDFVNERTRVVPASFEHVAYHPDHARAHWLKMTSFPNEPPPYRVDATVKNGHIHIGADRLNGVLVDRSLMPNRIREYPVVASKGLAVGEGEIDDQAIESTSDSRFPWSGIRDVFSRPFIIIDADENAGTISANVNDLAHGWWRYAQAVPLVKLEKDLGAEDLKNNNLILSGDPKTSPLMRKALTNSAIRIDDDYFTIGSRKFKRGNRGLICKLPNPWNPKQAVVVHCGVPWGKHAAVNHVYDSLPGFIIYEPEKASWDPDGGNRVVFAGFFDQDGKCSKITYEGDKRDR